MLCSNFLMISLCDTLLSDLGLLILQPISPSDLFVIVSFCLFFCLHIHYHKQTKPTETLIDRSEFNSTGENFKIDILETGHLS